MNITCYFNDNDELISVTYLDNEIKRNVYYCAYGSAEDCYNHSGACSLSDCDEMKKEGEVLKQSYEDLLKKYDITTEDIKEFAQYEYSYKLLQGE